MQKPKTVSSTVSCEKIVPATLAISKVEFDHYNYKQLPTIVFEPPFCLTDRTRFEHRGWSVWYKIYFKQTPQNLTIDFHQYETVMGFEENGCNVQPQISESENNTPQHRRHIFFDLSKSDTPRIYYFKVFARKWLASDSLQIRLEDTKDFHSHLHQEFYQNQHIAFWFLFVLGIGIFQLIYIGSLAWSRRKPEYINYWLFAFFGIIYLYVARRFELGAIGQLLPMWATSSIIVYMALLNIYYCRFVRFYLESKQLYPFLDKQYRMSEWFMGAGVVLNLLIYLFTLDLEYTFSFFIPFTNFILVLDLYMLLLLYRIKSPLVHYLMLGAAFFVLTTVMGFSYKYVYSLGWVHQLKDFNAYGGVLGSVLDAICLNLGLNYKHRLEVVAQQSALDNERNRIAAEMHDDLGTGLSAIRLLGERAQIGIENGEKRTQIQKITTQASDLIEKMSTIIWAMNSRNDTVDNLMQYIRLHTFEYLQEMNNLNLNFPLPNLAPSVLQHILAGEARREIFLTVKEALHNIVKHAEATHVWIIIQLINNDLEIKIINNGKVFNPKNVFGNGLKNMAERMKKINGHFKIFTNSDGHTEVTLTVPLTKVSQ